LTPLKIVEGWYVMERCKDAPRAIHMDAGGFVVLSERERRRQQSLVTAVEI